MRALVCIAAGFALSALAASSAAAGEDELIAAVEPAFAVIDGGNGADGLAYGLGAGVSAWVGTDGPLWLAGAVGLTGHFGLDDPVTFEALGGLVYAFDVFTVIPYVEGLAGFITGNGGVQPTARFGLGLDYLVSRTVSVGVVGRVRPLSEPLGNALITTHLRIAVRLEY